MTAMHLNAKVQAKSIASTSSSRANYKYCGKTNDPLKQHHSARTGSAFTRTAWVAFVPSMTGCCL